MSTATTRRPARPVARFAAAVAAAALALVTAGAAASPAGAAVPAAGSAVVTESNAFFQQAALAGIIAVPLPSATASYDGSAGFSGSFPVTGGTGSLTDYYGQVQLGGGLLVVDVRTGRSVAFTQLAFSADTWQLTGVPAGGTAPVALFDPAGENTVTRSGAVQSLTASALTVDAEGAQLLDQRLGTSFFTAGQSVGSFALTYTPAS
ncbi:hypothetical protein KNE206_39140 [Kitasatospora sp. NE20-6]|uniref:hypothetical protein n=1 Tax=Kitasatospora sp. NE20-6 TaxID=2859066 RepID=UPI0034DBE795